MFVYGDVGCMYTINGSRFYDAIADEQRLSSLMERLGVMSLEGYVTPSHARLMKFALRRVANVTERHTGMMAGHAMVWVVVEVKSP